MGVASVLKSDPVRLARVLMDSRDDTIRMEQSRARRLMLEDNAEMVIRRVINKTFRDESVKRRVYDYAAMARSQSIFKRVVNELARPVYMIPPVRSITPDEDQSRFGQIASECRLDCIMDNALRLSLAQNTSFVFGRFSPRLDRMILQVVPADAARVIADPDDPLEMLAFMYDYEVMLRDGTKVLWHAFWDDTVKFQLDHNGNIASKVEPNALGKIPVVAIHSAPRYASYWNSTAGDDLYESQNACSLLTLLAMRKLKARGFRAVAFTGDAVNIPKGQIWDEESAIFVPEGATLQELGSEADASNYLRMIESISLAVAANHGISRVRLNQDGNVAGSDVGLMEQRAEIIKFMRHAEIDLFGLIKDLSREMDEGRRLSADASMSIDFGELTQRVDPKVDLEIWKLKRLDGVANVLDQIKSENPEIRSDDEAWSELERNLQAESEYVRRIRALNIPADASTREPGKNPEENGAMGPMVRDAERDEHGDLMEDVGY